MALLNSIAVLFLVIGIGAFGFIQYSNADLVVLGKGHAPIYVSDKNTDEFDFNNDDLIDYYVRAHFTGNANQAYKVDYKFIDECVDGNNYQNAKLKIGFSSTDFFFFDRTWFTNFEVWTPWFKGGHNDDNKQIDLVSLPHGALPFPFPSSGDDVIISDGKKGSFTHKSNIAELDGQAGWEGSIFFRGQPGSYYLWTIHPGSGTSGCDTLTGFGIPIIIDQAR